MIIGAELICEKAVPVVEGNRFLMTLVARGDALPGSFGSDEYRLDARVLRGRRLAATGRRYVAELEKLPLGLGPVEAAPAVPCYVPDELVPDLVLQLNVVNPLLLSPGLVTDHLSLAVVGRSGRAACMPLARPDIEVEWIGRGRFRIRFGAALTRRVLQKLAS